MILGALLIGLITAYYFGIKPGITAAAACALLFIVSAVIPGTTLLVYGVVAVFIIGVMTVGPRRAKERPSGGVEQLRKLGKQAVRKLWKWL